MTQEQRIETLENEIANLKEELKRNRKANVWKKVKDKFTKEFNSFNWVYTQKITDCNNEELIIDNRNIDESYHVSQAIGTIVRIVLKRKGLVYLEDEDTEKAERITKQILEIMRKEQTNEKKTNEEI